MRPRQEVPHALISIDFIVSRLKIDTTHTFVDCDLCGLQSNSISDLKIRRIFFESYLVAMNMTINFLFCKFCFDIMSTNSKQDGLQQPRQTRNVNLIVFFLGNAFKKHPEGLNF